MQGERKDANDEKKISVLYINKRKKLKKRKKKKEKNKRNLVGRRGERK